MNVQPKWTKDPELKDLVEGISGEGTTMFTQEIADGESWVSSDAGLKTSTDTEMEQRVLEFQGDELARAIRVAVAYRLLDRESQNRIVDRGENDPRNAPRGRRVARIVDAIIETYSSNGADETQGLLSALEISRRLAPCSKVEALLATVYCNTNRPLQGMIHAQNAIETANEPFRKAMAWTWLAVAQRMAGVEFPVTSARKATALSPEFLFPWTELLRAGCYAEDLEAVKDAVAAMRNHPQLCSKEAFDKPATPPDLSYLPADILEAIPEGLHRFVESESNEGGQA